MGDEEHPVPTRAGAAGVLPRLVERVDRWHGRRERRRDRSEPLQIPPPPGRAVDEVHDLLGTAVPCTTCAGFDEAWKSALGRLEEASHHDGGRDLAEALWTVVRHVRPEQAVETGVAQGISTAVTLAAMQANGTGRLWSIDLPPPGDEWDGEMAAAVGPELQGRWTYIRGSSRRHLPPLLRRLGTLDLFLHDALHTYRSMSREFTLVWKHLSAGGALVSDDIDANPAFVDFARARAPRWLALSESGGKSTAFGIALRS